MYKRKSRLKPQVQIRLIEYFVAGSTARAAAELLDIQPNTAIRFFMRLRQLIASKLPSYELSGEIKLWQIYANFTFTKRHLLKARSERIWAY